MLAIELILLTRSMHQHGKQCAVLAIECSYLGKMSRKYQKQQLVSRSMIVYLEPIQPARYPESAELSFNSGSLPLQ